MKFLTPKIFVRINEGSNDEAQQLYAEWEAAGRAGRAHNAAIKDRIPPKLAEFIDAICLHDAEWMGLNVSPSGNGSHAPVAAINVRQGDDVVSMVYDLYEEPLWSGPTPESRIWTDDEQLICLYDEIDLLNDARFSHEILLSNGRVVRLVFCHFSFSPTDGAYLGRKQGSVLSELRNPRQGHRRRGQ